MKNQELDEILRSVPVPQRSGEYWQHFAGRVVWRLQERHRRPGREDQRSADSPVRARASRGWCAQLSALRFVPGLAGAAAVLALVCLAAGLALGFWKGRRSAAADRQLVEAQKYFQELQALFPNQLQAIVFDQQGAHLVLAEQADVPASPPLYLTVRGPEGCQRFVTFSGQQIHINREVCDVLLDRQGHVLLVGRQLVWCSARPAKKAGHYQIEATLLGITS